MTMQENPDRIVALDLETTGLDVDVDVPLEIAMIVLDNDLNELGVFNSVIPMPFWLWQARVLSQEVVFRMHERSGLYDELRSPDMIRLLNMGPVSVVEDAIDFLREHRAIAAPLLGNNIGFDRRFLQRHMPRLEGRLHYRNIDVSSLKEMARRHAPSVLAEAPVKRTEHRALADVRESIAEYRFYLDCGFIRRNHQPTTLIENTETN